MKKLHKEQKISDTEYVNKIKTVNEQIAPVITIVLYFGTEQHWTAPKSLKEVLDMPDDLEPFINDYKILDS